MSKELPDERALGDFHWNGVPLEDAPASWTECKSILDHTAWIVDNLRRCPFKTPREMIHDATDIERLFCPQMKRNEQEGKWEKAQLDLNDEHKATALALYLFHDMDDLIHDGSVECCAQCEECAGPGDTCYSGERHVFGAACFNCLYNDTAELCTFKKAADARKFLGLTLNFMSHSRMEKLDLWLDLWSEIYGKEHRERRLKDKAEEESA